MIYKHSHTGGKLKKMVFDPLRISEDAFAEILDLPAAELADLFEGKVGIDKELAEKLEQAGYGKARFWLAVQEDYDNWLYKQEGRGR